jgi:hypothetical protein
MMASSSTIKMAPFFPMHLIVTLRMGKITL